MENVERDSQYYTDIIAAMAERTIKRIWMLCIALVILLAASLAVLAAVLAYESQFECVEETTQEVTQNADGASYNKFVGGDFHGGNANS